MDLEKIESIAEEISFAFEDHYTDLEKRNLFLHLFNKYFPIVENEEVTEPYEAVVLLGRSDPLRLEYMLNEMKSLSLLDAE
jgi:hypothetical protein